MWIIIALFSAIMGALGNVYQKKNTLHFNAYLIIWAILVGSSILYLPLLIRSSIPTSFGPQFWPAVIARVIIDSIAFTLFVKALERSHLSLAMPMTSFQPVFLLFISILINHLLPAPLGIVGVLVIAAGVYYLNFDHDTRHLLSPFKNIAKERGVQLVLLATLLWSFVFALMRLGIDNSNVFFYTAFFQMFWAICFTPIAIMADRQAFMRIFRWRNLWLLAPMGVIDALQMISSNYALSLTLPVYVSAITSTSILFAAIFGHYFFGEKISNKLVPTSIIIIGVILITVSQA